MLFLAAVTSSCGARSSLSERTPHPETCNGLDDDGNGIIDDVPPMTCGVGACRVEVPGCVDGRPSTCTPRAPSPEVCNGVDDDCNGAIDDGLGFGSIAGPFTVATTPPGILGASLVATANGLLAVWSVGFNGSAPVPNTFSRVLDPDGIPQGSPAGLLPQRSVPVGPRAAPSAEDEVILGYCGRFGAEDRATSTRVTATGEPIGPEIQREPKGRSCTGISAPSAVWTGTRQLFAWTTNAASPSLPPEVVLDVADASGTSVGFRSILEDADGDATARLAVNGASAALIAGTRAPGGVATRLAFALLDQEGQSLGSPLVIDPPVAGGSWGRTEIAAAASGGFIALGGNRDEPGIFRALFSASGALVEPPAQLEGMALTVDAITLALAAREGGGFVLVSNAIEGADARAFAMALSDDGRVTGTWFADAPDEPWFFSPSVATRAGRVFVLYQTVMTQPSELRVRELGCLP
ncbi:Type IV fimbrial biogenesis protein PilY1 [Minicystis rosea]|nr:Type IV fimbrial biogenesis protein PilY1 [Minicystis rosea]